jgi:hypothetical protein
MVAGLSGQFLLLLKTVESSLKITHSIGHINISVICRECRFKTELFLAFIDPGI